MAGTDLMAPRPTPLTPHASARHYLGAELRWWRESRQLSSAELAGKVFVSQDLIRKVERAQRRADVDLIAACDVALDTGGTLGRLLDYVRHLEQAAKREPLPTPHTPPVSIRLNITAEVVPDIPDTPPGTAPPGEARIYAFPGSGRRSRDGP